jgi:hypothetical protein
MGDALEVLERVPDASLRFVYLLHPDPWPKARHAKRRMVNHGPLDLIAAKLQPGGEFRLGTDDPTYCRWSMMIMNQRRDFEWLAESAKDFLTRPGGWPETRYEAKARRKGHEVWYFRYRALRRLLRLAIDRARSRPEVSLRVFLVLPPRGASLADPRGAAKVGPEFQALGAPADGIVVLVARCAAAVGTCRRHTQACRSGCQYDVVAHYRSLRENNR